MSLSEGLSLLGDKDWKRRDFVVTMLASGFALSVQPVSAQTITTDDQGLVAGEVKIDVREGQLPAYRAMPAAGGPFPVVLVVQEIFGVHEHIKDICRRFAKLGYLARSAGALCAAGRCLAPERHPGDLDHRRFQSA